MKAFKIRCSAIGKIMTEPKSKTELLSKTTISYLEEWAKSEIYGRSKDITSKYLNKGINCEDEALTFASLYLGEMLVKNEQMYYDDYMIGTPDVITDTNVIDIKSSWDCFTFPLFDKECPNKDYYWQLQGYMALTGKQQARLIYFLCDTPDILIIQEANRYCYANWIERDDADIYEQFRAKMTYPDIPNDKKIRIFEIERNQDDINKIIHRVLTCNHYITNNFAI